MARSEARISVSIWSDDDFLALTPAAQWLYLFLISQPDLSHLGMLALREKRWSRAAKGMTLELIGDAIAELSEERFIVVDADAEEVLIRSFLRRDEVYRQPNLLRAAEKQLPVISSPILRGALAVELRRILAAPDITDTCTEIAKRMLKALPNPSTTPPTGPTNVTTIHESRDADARSLGIRDTGQSDSQFMGQRVFPGQEASSNPSTNPSRTPLGDRGVVTAVTTGFPSLLHPSPLPLTPRSAPAALRASAAERIVLEATDATPDEALAIAERVQAERNPRSLPGLLRAMARDGDLPQFLVDLRAATRKAGVTAQLAIARTGPECDHGVPGGINPHPTSGKPICPQCRRLAPLIALNATARPA